jgi:hypothetical protein
MHAQPLGHLVLVQVELLARNNQLLSECQFSHAILPNPWQVRASLAAASGRLTALKGHGFIRAINA